MGYVSKRNRSSKCSKVVAAAKQLTEETGTGWHVIKAQVHAGGRGKAVEF